jgi:hypothetical protein
VTRAAVTARAAAAAVTVIAALAVAAALAGCGSGSLSDTQLHARAQRICQAARRQTGRIASPTTPSAAQAIAFLTGGVAVLAPAQRALLRLHAPGNARTAFRSGVGALGDELEALRATLQDVRAGRDPVAAIQELQRHLAGPEQRAARAFHTLGADDCAALTA